MFSVLGVFLVGNSLCVDMSLIRPVRSSGIDYFV